MSTRLLWLFPFVVVLAGCGGAAHEAGSPQLAEAPLVGVSVAPAALEQWPATYESTGTVRARSSAVVSAKWMGYVREVRVQVGDRVREGQLLVSLDARDLDAGSNRALAATEEIHSTIPEADSGVAAAKASLDLSQATFHRMNELYSKKSISDQEFDEANARLKSAKASYEMALAKRTQLDSKLAQAEQELRAAQVSRSYAQIEAPFAGMVTAKFVDPGSLAVPGAPLLTIERDGYRLEASVEESKLTTIRLGQAATVTLDGIDRAFEARVSEIVPAVDAASRAYIVKIDLPATPGVRSGLFGRAAFRLGSRQTLAIPAAAVVERGQLQSVFVVDGGWARTRLVTIGEKAGDHVEVLSGLSAGDNVIAPAPKDLADGARVKAKP